MPVVASAREPFGGDGSALRPSAALQQLEQGVTHCLLKFIVALDLDVGALPKRPEEVLLLITQSRPPTSRSRREGALDLGPNRGQGPLGRPAIRDELLDPQGLALAETGGDR